MTRGFEGHEQPGVSGEPGVEAGLGDSGSEWRYRKSKMVKVGDSGDGGMKMTELEESPKINSIDTERSW